MASMNSILDVILYSYVIKASLFIALFTDHDSLIIPTSEQHIDVIDDPVLLISEDMRLIVQWDLDRLFSL